jgi:hypothetical protein
MTTMPITTSPFVLDDVSLTLVPTAGGTAEEYQCQLNRAELVPAAGTSSGNSFETFCDTYSSSGGNSSWTLELTGFQAYVDAADLSMLLFNDEGVEYDFVLTPAGGVISATNPAFDGTVTLVPTNIGGTANQYAQFSVSLPCSGKPTAITTPPV